MRECINELRLQQVSAAGPPGRQQLTYLSTDWKVITIAAKMHEQRLQHEILMQ